MNSRRIADQLSRIWWSKLNPFDFSPGKSDSKDGKNLCVGCLLLLTVVAIYMAS